MKKNTYIDIHARAQAHTLTQKQWQEADQCVVTEFKSKIILPPKVKASLMEKLS